MSAKGGYRGSSLAFLEKIEAEVGDGLELNTGWGTVHGTLVPRYQYDDESHIVVKLSSGYNIGLDVSKLEGGRVVSKGEVPTFRAPPAGRASPDLPRVALLSTGGTIASRVDYRTGAVHPVVSASELNSLVPELFEIAGVEPEILMSVLSENLQPKDWTAIATRVARSVEDGVAGVVVTQGTDTLGYTAAALSFALKGVPVPVVITGAQRSSDRPSSDAFLNLTASVSIASTAGFSGVYVAMHDDSSDGLVAFTEGLGCGRTTPARGGRSSQWGSSLRLSGGEMVSSMSILPCPSAGRRVSSRSRALALTPRS
ncbi:MAG TPA: asparaginase domain-containing protein [Nitrososphaerales archaeon]|nr:asparaginase domain-containing protein [Nitrososphaerales archaeon]